ncbi:ABC-2 type transport system permease protein [Saccharopolyspora kobensis]|uniref:ABC-2 type transport system permease protein n=1 Tax=Saccharopolyspora kobensis TaxID=146035 RepID=A0A1H5SXN2_9PSEU|nr:ABC-2 type transport system permease protein [Saccharopolyspora kobensis]SFC53205.1 ABC-2 type transport system permease protein [Saccharopolyspora kobensis]
MTPSCQPKSCPTAHQGTVMQPGHKKSQNARYIPNATTAENRGEAGLRVTAHRIGARAWALLIRSELKMVVRDTAGLIVPLGMPILILVMNAAGAGGEEVGAGLTALEAFVLPLVLTIVIAMLGLINMPSFLATYRKTGVLRRLAVTPASPLMVLIAQVVVSLAQVLLGTAAALGIAVLAFGAQPPRDLGVAIGVLALSVAAMYALGMVVASVAPTPNSSVAIGLVLFFALGALGGLFGGTGGLGDTAAQIGQVLPFGASVQALAAAWAGQAVATASLVSLAVTAVLGTTASALLFRWDR